MKKQTIAEFLNPTRSDRYTPTLDGKNYDNNLVEYLEIKPSSRLSQVVQSYWMLKTKNLLQHDFILHALPDACVNLLFNQLQLEITAVTQLQTNSVELNLGKEFHFVGIQLNTGVFCGSKSELKRSYVGSGYNGNLPLLQTNQELNQKKFIDQIPVLEGLIEVLLDEGVLTANPIVEKIIQNLKIIHSVTDMAQLVNKSERQLQRIIQNTLGLAPREFLKVLRLQQSFTNHYTTLYADQAHYTNSFKNATGYTPIRYAKKFNV
jgi:AraC-like DNA-binding protein